MNAPNAEIRSCTAGLALVLALACAPASAQTAAPSTEGSPAAPAADPDVRELRERIDGLERRLGSSALLELVTRIERLAKEVQELRDRIEIQAHALDALQTRQQDLYAELDRLAERVARPGADSVVAGGLQLPGAEGRGSGSGSPDGTAATPATPEAPAMAGGNARASAETPAPGAADPGAEPSGTTAAIAEGAGPYDAVEEQARYQRAFDLLSEGRFELAATAFTEFLAAFPQSRYQDTARFWKGECLYALRRFEPSLEEFRALVAVHPESPRIAGAQLKIGFILHELGRTSEAAEALRALIESAPESSEAKLARARLERLN